MTELSCSENLQLWINLLIILYNFKDKPEETMVFASGKNHAHEYN